MKKELEEKRLNRTAQKQSAKDDYSLLVTGESLLLLDSDWDTLQLPKTSDSNSADYFREAIQQNTHKQAFQQSLIYLALLDSLQAKDTGYLQKVDISILKSDKIPTSDPMILVYLFARQLGNYHTDKKIDPFDTLEIPTANNDLYWFWFEFLCYFYVYVLKEQGDVDQIHHVALVYLSRFPTELHNTPTTSLKRIAILGEFLQVVVGRIPTPTTSFDIHERIPTQVESMVKEARSWIGVYERLVVGLCPFPKSLSEDNVDHKRYERVLECYDWYCRIELCGRFGDDAVGDIIDRCYRLLETLYRATTHTFQSLRILRYISYTFLKLIKVAGDNMSMDEKREALHAVESYLFHWEKEFTLLLDVKVREQRDEELNKHEEKEWEPPSPSRFLSHRLSGQISQLAVPSFGPTLPDIASFDEELEMDATKQTQSKKVVVVEHVHGETVPDVIGVLITGIRLVLITHEGNVTALKRAATMGEKALIILNEHGLQLQHYKTLVVEVYQWLGVVYGELGLETIKRDERNEFQVKGMEMLKNAVELVPSSILRYQYAVALVEMGEVESAMEQVKMAVEGDPSQPVFYNLMALILDSMEQTKKAIEICKSGWRCCIEFVFVNQVKNHVEAKDMERMINWDIVDSVFKEELFNLRFTCVALEMKVGETNGMIEGLQRTFTLLRRMIGVPPAALAQEDGRERRTSLAHSLLNGNRSTNSSIPKSMSSSFIPIFHRFKVYEFQIALWLTVSSVYRSLKQLDKAAMGLDEAEKMLQLLVVAHDKVRHQTSRLFKERVVDSLSYSTQSVRNSREPTSKKPVPLYSGGYWKDSDPCISRLQADIALEKALIQYELVKKENEKEPPNKYSKYLSPLARVESEQQANQRLQQRHMFQSSASLDTISIFNTVLTDHGSVMNDDASVRMYRIETENDMDQVIQKTQLALLFDRYHLPARTFLASVYREIGDIAQSEHHLQLACTANRHRSSCSGKTGQTSWFGGTTSMWGWYSWYLLGLTFGDQNRLVEASKASSYALEKRSGCCVRGFECLPRYL